MPGKESYILYHNVLKIRLKFPLLLNGMVHVYNYTLTVLLRNLIECFSLTTLNSNSESVQCKDEYCLEKKVQRKITFCIITSPKIRLTVSLLLNEMQHVYNYAVRIIQYTPTITKSDLNSNSESVQCSIYLCFK